MSVSDATVVYVHDGDTFGAVVTVSEVDQLYKGRIDKPWPIRLRGCNAIELGRLGGTDAASNLATILTPGRVVQLEDVAADFHPGRWDARVLVDGEDLIQRLIDEGWLAAYPGKGPKVVPPWPRVPKKEVS